jgi:polyhydroxyalkanoate synthase subunit PhaC
MHYEYLTSLYLRNALTSGAYLVDGYATSPTQLQMPLFVVRDHVVRDHIPPWASVCKLHYPCDVAITFILTTGGHNTSIISAPGHPKRSYQMTPQAANGVWVKPAQWSAQAPLFEGSWWLAW